MKINKGKTYKCVYASGGGTDYDEGLWQIKALTEKTIVIEKISEKFVYGNYERGEKIKCGIIKSNGNPLRDWGDGTFTIYPDQAGIPYYFEPIL